MTLTSLVAVVGATASPASAARDWYVATWGDDSSSGTASTPYRTIQAAVNEARSGDTVIVRSGTYRESVQVYGKSVHVRSKTGERAVLDGGNSLKWAIYLNRAHGSKLTNLTVQGYVTPASNMAAVRLYSNNVVATGMIVQDNSRMGLSAIGANIAVRDGRFVRNGHVGVHGHQLLGFSLERSAVRDNNAGGYDPTHDAGGMKITNSWGLWISDNDVSDNAGPGIWTDIDTSYVTVARNLVEGNQRAGIEIELSSGVNVLSNVVLDNGEAGIWILESQRVQVMHNASFGNQNAIEVEEGPRRNVASVRIMNNTMGEAANGSRALLDVNDWTEDRSAWEMGVTVDYNGYWIAPNSASENVSRWGRWPQSLGYSSTLAKHQDVTGQGNHSLVSRATSNPYLRSASSYDYRGPDSLNRGAPLPRGAAAALGIAAGERRRIGPVGPVYRR